jgi:hypothetical protein
LYDSDDLKFNKLWMALPSLPLKLQVWKFIYRCSKGATVLAVEPSLPFSPEAVDVHQQEGHGIPVAPETVRMP